MVTEIELKAHVQDSEALKRCLSEKSVFLCSFEKNDTYWLYDEVDYDANCHKVSGLPPSGLRVRSEKRIFSDGSEESTTYATYKIKEVRDGIEINEEHEFEVHPTNGHDNLDFKDFLGRIGLKPGASKRKQGWAFSHEGISAELLEVDGIGWFVELEIVADNPREETFTKGKQRLLDFLASLEIGKDKIESRFYSEMLKNL